MRTNMADVFYATENQKTTEEINEIEKLTLDLALKDIQEK